MSATELSVEIGVLNVSIRPGYDGNRHYDEWIEHKVAGGVTIWTYPDGQLIQVEVPAAHCTDYVVKGMKD